VSLRDQGAPRTLAGRLVQALSGRIRSGELAEGRRLPTEAALMDEHGVSRTVVREALSQLQAAGLVETRHGVGTFVLEGAGAAPLQIRPRHLATLQDVVALLELRLGVETEAASLAAQRRSERNLAVMRGELDALAAAVAAGEDGAMADFRFHREIARATQNAHFAQWLGTLGPRVIPRARLRRRRTAGGDRQDYLLRVRAEHEGIYEAIRRQDADAARAAMRTHLSNSRERRRQEAAAAPGVVR
jgi:GntR family transcriptional repressor for pyruvate dehydrogenase complex